MCGSGEMLLYVRSVVSCDAQAQGRAAGRTNACSRVVTVTFRDPVTLNRERRVSAFCFIRADPYYLYCPNYRRCFFLVGGSRLRALW